MIGFIAIGLAVVCTLAAALLFLVQHRLESKEGRILDRRLNRILVYLAGLSVLAASADLFYIILTNQFQYKYVWSYSSLDLPFLYKMSVFWAGQEGSFLLWLLIHSLIGVLLVFRRTMRSLTLSFYNWVQLAVLLMTAAKNPFMMLAEPKADGAGLNPLLQDPWMAIHPPVIFIGYALLAIPFCYALGSLFLPDKHRWIDRALGWTLLAWGMLGAGMFIGGYWAYKVLGWGGYWGWDPVENSSLVPWFIASALIHCLLWARVRIGAVKPAYFAALFSYGFVLYGTFLTRSGVLSDFSVHSFSGDGIGFLLAFVLAVVVLTALVLVAIQWNELPDGRLYAAMSSRSFILGLGMLTIIFMAVLVSLGMSLPLLTGLAGQPQSVAPVFYNKTLLPLAVLMLLFMMISSAWRWEEREKLPAFLYGAAGAAFLLGVFIGWQLHFKGILSIVALGVSAAVIVVHLYLAGRRISRLGAVAHCGVGILIAGILLSSAGNQSEIRTLVQDEMASVFKYEVVYKGESETPSARYQIFTVDGQTVKLLTKLDIHGMESAKEPGIYHSIGGDFYIAPANLQTASHELVLERKKAIMYDSLLLRFDGLAEESMPGAPENRLMKAKIHLSDGATVEEAVLIMVQDGAGYKSIPLSFVNNRYQLQLTGIAGDGSRIRLELIDYKAAVSQFEAEFSYKPFVWLVWLGAVVITLAGLLAALKYFKLVNHVKKTSL